jgi:hypothetical protein
MPVKIPGFYISGFFYSIVTIANFDKSVLIEQIRYIETSQQMVCDHEMEFADLSKHHDFHERLWQRAECLVRQYDLSDSLSHAAKLSRYIKIFMLMLVAVLGAMGSVYAITNTHTINIYWLLLVLLGFNFISMLLWLIGISLNMQGLASGLLARITSWLPGIFDYKTHTDKQDSTKTGKLADKAWLKCYFTAAVGKWQLSKITHQLWLVYLLSGLTFLVLLLMVKQYDFVWGTTLLSDSIFIKLTDVLSRPLEFMGFMTPTVDQVTQSRLGAEHVLNAEHRSSWAQFLLGSLLCFGILPRFLLLLWSSLMSRRARSLFALDLYLPYYISLRQRLMPMATHGKIVDADTLPPESGQTTAHSPDAHSLPENTKWVAVELGDQFSWPISSISTEHSLGQVIDRDSLASISQLLQAADANNLAVAVDATRSPDRGVQRTIASLMSNCSQRWLVMLQPPDEEEASSKHLAAWYRLAEACEIPPDHVISLTVDL